MDFIFRGDAIHTTRSGLPAAVKCMRRFSTSIDIDVRPSRTILLKSLDAVGDGNAGRPIGFQSSCTEVEFVLNPERVTNEIVETAVYLREARYGTSDVYITPYLFQLEDIGDWESLEDIFQKFPGKAFELVGIGRRHDC